MGNKKLSNKKPLAPAQKIPPQVKVKVDAEYNALYEQRKRETEKRIGGELKGMYFRWFDEEMWWEYQSIRDKYMKQYNETHKKTAENQQEKE